VLDNCNFSNSNANNQSGNSSNCNQDDSEGKPNPVGFYYFNIHDDFSKDKSNNYKYSGRSIKDMEICKQLDTALANDKKSARLGVTFAKAKDDKGKEIPGKLDFSVNSHVLTANQLMAEIDYALMLIAKAGQLIKDGYVAINPIEKCCDYCDYSSICDYQDIHNYPARKETKANADQIEEIVKNAKKKKRI
jgi:ATP-dependent helicase/DNAse subunit B